MVLSVWMSRGNRDRWATGTLDPPPLGEREYMDFLRESYESELPDEARQSQRLADLGLRSTASRRARICGFP